MPADGRWDLIRRLKGWCKIYTLGALHITLSRETLVYSKNLQAVIYPEYPLTFTRALQFILSWSSSITIVVPTKICLAHTVSCNTSEVRSFSRRFRWRFSLLEWCALTTGKHIPTFRGTVLLSRSRSYSERESVRARVCDLVMLLVTNSL